MKQTKTPSRFARDLSMTAELLRSVPHYTTVILIVTVITMNFLSRITLVSLPWLALNAGILVSWLSFLTMDVMTKHYGAKAANLLSLVAVAANLLCCAVCAIISVAADVPGLDMVLGGQWSILLASSIAYIVSALTNNYTNIRIGRLFVDDPESKKAYAARSFVSTLLSQIVDNFLFVFLAFVVFPNLPGAFPVRWTLAQCFGASIACAFFELFSEMIFSPLGYSVARRWKAKGIGAEFIAHYCPDGVLGG